MARIKMTGFEHGNASAFFDVAGPAPGNQIVTDFVHGGDYSWQAFGNSGEGTIPGSPDEIYVRWYFYRTVDSGHTEGFRFGTNTTDPHVLGRYVAGSDDYIRFDVPEGQFPTSSGSLKVGVWQRIEFRCFTHNTDGILQVKIDGVLEIDQQGIDTKNNLAAGSFQRFSVGAWGADRARYDDFGINDTTGTRNNSWLGEGEIIALRPNAAGDNTDLTPTSGANYTNVDDDDPGPDDATSIVSSSTVGQYDLYNLTNASPTSDNQCEAIAVYTRAKVDSGAANFKRVIKSGGTEDRSGNTALTTSFDDYVEIIEDNPVTGSRFTIAELDALQAGVEVG